MAVPRPRLESMLTAGVDRPVTLVSAGPGTGKTLAVAGWLAAGHCHVPCAWLALDEADNDPATFRWKLLAALRTSGVPPSGDSSIGAVSGARGNAAGRHAARAGLVTLSGPLVLVFDDLHKVGDPRIYDGIAWLLEHLPASVHLVLITRSDPDLPVHRLRVCGDLTEIRATELVFTATEADELLARHGLVLTTSQRDTLLARTEGWATGLRLAAMSLGEGDLDRGIASFSGKQPPVAEYLLREILDPQSPETRDFLLRTSVAPLLTGSLADTLTGRADSRRLLERLSATNALITAVGPTRQWFRCHILLREALAHRILLEDPGLVPELHRRAAEWFAGHGAVLDAVHQAVRADDMQILGRNLVRIAVPELMSPTAAPLAAAVRPIAARAGTESGWESLLCAVVCHYHNREYIAMAHNVEAAEQLIGADPKRVPAAVGTALALWKLADSRVRGDAADVVNRAERVLGTLREHVGDTPGAAQYRLVARGNLGAGQLWLGQHIAAGENLTTAAAQATQLGLELPSLNALALLAVVNGDAGALRLASARARAAIRIAQRHDWLHAPQLVAAYLALALVALERHELTEVSSHLTDGLMADRNRFDAAAGTALRIAGIRLLIRQGDARLALDELARLPVGDAGTPVPPLLRQWISDAEAEGLLLTGNANLVRARYATRSSLSDRQRTRLALAHLALGEPEAARQAVRPLPDSAGGLIAAIEGSLVEALVADQCRRDGAAMESLQHALALAEPEGIVGPFHLAGTRIAAILRRHQGLTTSSPLFIARILSTWSRSASPPPAVPVTTLTDRELAILRHLAAMRSNNEIGEALHITVNTVKTHLKTLYRKLDVANRREAVRRARELDILWPVR